MIKLRIGLDLDLQDDDKNILLINFTKPDDFYPDNIFQQQPLFANIQDIRRKAKIVK